MPFSFSDILKGTDVKAVPQRDGSVYGLVRIVAKEDTDSVFSLCGIFETDRQRGRLFLHDEALFFYGTQRDLNQNYRREIPLPDSDLETYLDRRGINHTPMKRKKVEPSPTVWDEYYAIPVPVLNLAPRQRDFLQRTIVPRLRELLPDALAEMVEYPVVEQNLPSVKAAINSFRGYPLAFRADAWEQGRYYRLIPTKTKRTIPGTRRVLFPDLQPASRPLNTAPPWVRPYLAAQPASETETFPMF